LLLAAGAKPFLGVGNTSHDGEIEAIRTKAIFLHIKIQSKPISVRKEFWISVVPFWDDFITDNPNQISLADFLL